MFIAKRETESYILSDESCDVVSSLAVVSVVKTIETHIFILLINYN